MALYIQTSGSGITDPAQAFADLTVISNYDTDVHIGPVVNNAQKITLSSYALGTPKEILYKVAMGNYSPNYSGTPIHIDVYILAVDANFWLSNGHCITDTCGITLAPNYSNAAHSNLNSTPHCLIIYDTSQNNGAGYCVARQTQVSPLIPSYDLNMPNPVILLHELSHALRVLEQNIGVYPTSCYMSGPGEEFAAINDENLLRLQMDPNGHTREPNDSCSNPGCPHVCCIIASVTSGSSVSAVVEELRSVRDDFLRKTEIGFAFFKSLFFDYYSFSPQVCTMMAGHPDLRKRVLNGFVLPLLRMLQLVRRYALDDLDDHALGELFLRQAGDSADREMTLAALADAEAVWQGANLPPSLDARRLSELLSQRAWASDHVRWALVEPVDVYRRLLSSTDGFSDPAAAGSAVRAAIEQWAPRIPIDHEWASLPIDRLCREIGILERLLLKRSEVGQAFLERLRGRFGTIEPIRALVSSRAPVASPA